MMKTKTTFHSWFLATVLAIGASQTVHAEEVTDWNQIMLAATITPPATPGPTSTRGTAIVQAAVFDAVNGIERRYTPIHVPPAAPPGASKRAAAVQAAYASLVRLYPALTATFDQQRMLSLAAIASGRAAEHSKSIERGIEWGQKVADAIWTWPSTDGFDTALPPFMGGAAAGEWRPTPPGFVPGLFHQLAITAPWVIQSPSQFRSPCPPPLTSPQYTTDYDETLSKGRKTSLTRTADATNFSVFWASTNPASLWDPLAISLAAQGHFTMSKTSRLRAHVSLARAAAAIRVWVATCSHD